MLQHVAHETRPADADAVLAFWALLGFADVELPVSLRGRTHWVERGGTQIHLLLTDESASRCALVTGMSFARLVVPPSGHTAIVVDDHDATLSALRAAGHPVEPRAEHWGAPRAFVTDPSGHVVEVMAEPPPG